MRHTNVTRVRHGQLKEVGVWHVHTYAQPIHPVAFVIATDSAPGSTHNSPAHHSYPINAHHNYPSLAASLPQSTSSAGGGGNASVSTATSSTENRRTGTNAPIRVCLILAESRHVNHTTFRSQRIAVAVCLSTILPVSCRRAPFTRRSRPCTSIIGECLRAWQDCTLRLVVQ
jgi:hypothetical protein